MEKENQYILYQQNKSVMVNPMMKKAAYQYLFYDKFTKIMVQLTEESKNCYKIENTQKHQEQWLQLVDKCFSIFLIRDKQGKQIIEETFEAQKKVDQQYQIKLQNCSSLVSEQEMEACMKNSRQEELGELKKIYEKLTIDADIFFRK